MRSLLTLVCLLFVHVSGGRACAADKPWPEPDVSFFTKLRMDYAKQPNYSPVWDIEDERKAVFAAMREKDYPRTVKLAEAWLAKVPVDADAHYVCAYALKLQGELPRRMYHLHYFYGLMQSIAASGDGRTPATAFKVISVAEEYYLLHDFGAEVIGQELEGECDAMHCKVGGQEVTYYFDVSISFAAMRRELKPQK